MANLSDPPATLIMKVEIPAFGLTNALSFGLKPVAEGQKEVMLERITGSIVEIAGDMSDQLLCVDWEGSEEKLEHWRGQATQALEDWGTKLKSAEEGLIRVDLAKKQMNDMREAYYKELTHLRQQLCLKEEAEKRGTEFKASELTLFDPFSYSWREEDAPLLRQKAEALQRDFEGHRSRCSAQVEEMKAQLQTARMLTHKKDQLLQELMSRHGYKSEVMLERQLAHLSVPKEEEIDKKVDTVESLSMNFQGSITSNSSMATRKVGSAMRAFNHKANAAASKLRGALTYRRSGSTRSVRPGASQLNKAGTQNSFDSGAGSRVQTLTDLLNVSTCDAAMQTDLEGQDVDEAIMMLFDQRSEKQWNELLGCDLPGACNGDEATRGSSKLAAAAAAMKEARARGRAEISVQTEEAPKAETEDLGIQCSIFYCGTLLDSEMTETEVPSNIADTMSSTSVQSLSTPSQANPKQNSVSGSLVLGDILNKHGMLSVGMYASENAAEEMKNQQRQGSKVSAGPRGRRISAPASRGGRGGAASAPDDFLGTLMSVTPSQASSRSRASSCQSPIAEKEKEKSPSANRTHRRTEAVTPQVVADLTDKIAATASAQLRQVQNARSKGSVSAVSTPLMISIMQ